MLEAAAAFDFGGTVYFMLELENLKKSFDNKLVLNNINLKIRNREIVSVFGPPGSGKSTLLNLIQGLITGDCGRILLDGKDITSVAQEERQVNIVFRDFDFVWDWSVYKNITYPLKERPVSTMSEVNSLIQFMGLDSLLTQKLIQISGEDRLKVALVKTMTMRPKALLLDEPFRFLTRSGSDSVRQCIRDILRYYNICALVTGSRYEDVCSFSDRVFCLKEGILTPFQELNDSSRTSRRHLFVKRHSKNPRPPIDSEKKSVRINM